MDLILQAFERVVQKARGEIVLYEGGEYMNLYIKWF